MIPDNPSPMVNKDNSQMIRELQEKLRRRLASLGKQIEIQWQNDYVVLHGRVRSYYDKQRVQEAVKSSCSLPKVLNKIIVEPSSC